MTTALDSTAEEAGVAVEVGPGGRLRAIQISPRAMRLGGGALAALIVALVDSAAARSNQRARLAWPQTDLDALGLYADAARAEDVEHTTPDTWMRR